MILWPAFGFFSYKNDDEKEVAITEYMNSKYASNCKKK